MNLVDMSPYGQYLGDHKIHERNERIFCEAKMTQYTQGRG